MLKLLQLYSRDYGDVVWHTWRWGVRNNIKIELKKVTRDSEQVTVYLSMGDWRKLWAASHKASLHRNKATRQRFKKITTLIVAQLKRE